jgi:hypothetical protein
MLITINFTFNHAVYVHVYAALGRRGHFLYIYVCPTAPSLATLCIMWI